MVAESASTEGKDKTIWHHLSGHSPLGRLQAHNVFTARKGVTNYCRNILTLVDAWRLLMDEGCIRYILQCTSEQASELVPEWSLSEEEIEAFIGLLYLRAVMNQRNFRLTFCGLEKWDLRHILPQCHVIDFVR